MSDAEESTPLGIEIEKTFSPVIVRESPVSKTPQRGNLTGSPRKVRDSAAEIYNLIQEWNNYIFSGSEVLLKINTLKSEDLRDNKNDPKSSYPDGLQELCNDLDKIYLQMQLLVRTILLFDCLHGILVSGVLIGRMSESSAVKVEVVNKMQVTAGEIEGIIKLERLRGNCEIPMFLTWPVDRFGDVWQTITKAYIKELDLKKHIKENVAHASMAANLMFFVSSWVHQPYLDTSVNLSLEALLKETGHR